jgi:hypothetical protein
MKKFRYIRCIGYIAATLLTLSGCVEADVRKRTAYNSEYNVRLIYDWQPGTTLPDNHMQLNFFPVDGGSPLVYQTSYWGFEGYVPPGDYQVLAFNTAPSGVELSHTHTYQTAQAHSVPSNEVSFFDDDYTLLQPTEPLYSLDGGVITVPAAGRTDKWLPVKLLSSKILLMVHNLSGRPAVDVTYRLRGLAYTRRLSDGSGHINEEGIGAYEEVLPFDHTNNTYTIISCLGLFNPILASRMVHLYDGMIDMEVSYLGRSISDNVSCNISEHLSIGIGDQEFAENLQIDIDLEEDDDGNLNPSITVSHWNGVVVQHKDF